MVWPPSTQIRPAPFTERLDTRASGLLFETSTLSRRFPGTSPCASDALSTISRMPSSGHAPPRAVTVSKAYRPGTSPFTDARNSAQP
jgi:hypothetical protein